MADAILRIDTTEVEAALDRIQRQAQDILIMLDDIETRRARLGGLDPAGFSSLDVVKPGQRTCDNCGGGIFVHGICTTCHNNHSVGQALARAAKRA